ncbi:MAG: divergent polysaccharide deacetylase family protein [Desulfobacteraceae bacterium]
MAEKKNASNKTRQKKTGQKKKSKKGSQSKKGKGLSLTDELKKIVVGIAVLVFIVATAAMIFDFYLNRENPPKNQAKRAASADAGKTAKTDDRGRYPGGQGEQGGPGLKKPLAGLKEKPAAVAEKEEGPVFEIFDDSISPGKKERKPDGDFQSDVPRVAIIIDDIGFDREMATALNRLDQNITLSILPGSPFGRQLAAELHEKGSEIMLHLPMEPVQYPEVDPGPGAILSEMSPDELLWQLRKNLDSLPHVRGVNNHMGSRITAQSSKMHQIFTVLKQRQLFFIDSLTSRKTLCRASASLLQVSFGQRDIFLDNVQEQEYIKQQINKLVNVAKRHGTAIGIGHPYAATLEALEQVVPALRNEVNIVPASTLTAIPG